MQYSFCAVKRYGILIQSSSKMPTQATRDASLRSLQYVGKIYKRDGLTYYTVRIVTCNRIYRCLIGDWFEHSMDVADEHSRVTNDVLLHEVDGVVNLARSAQHLNDGVMLVLVPE